jgi:hypothetical protein
VETAATVHANAVRDEEDEVDSLTMIEVVLELTLWGTDDDDVYITCVSTWLVTLCHKRLSPCDT